MERRYILIIVILALIIGGGIFWLATREETSDLKPLNLVEGPDGTTNWLVYQNTKYGYQLKYPKDWLMQENQTAPYQYVAFGDPDENLVLTFGLKVKGSKLKLTNREGVGTGDFIKGEVIKIGNIDVQATYLVYQGKVKEIFYPAPGINFEINGLEAYMRIREGGYSSLDYYNLDIISRSEFETIKQILSTFEFIR